MTMNHWPNDYPLDVIIPPKDAIELDDQLYRCVTNNKPNGQDFLASYKDPKQRHLAKKHSKTPAFYATSFFNTENSIQSVIDGNPERFSGQKIAKGHIKPPYGKGCYSLHNNHVSVWFYDGVIPNGFEVL